MNQVVSFLAIPKCGTHSVSAALGFAESMDPKILPPKTSIQGLNLNPYRYVHHPARLRVKGGSSLEEQLQVFVCPASAR